MDSFYHQLGLPMSATPRDVDKTAAKSLHPWFRRQHSLRVSRRRFYREILNEHDAEQDLARILRA